MVPLIWMLALSAAVSGYGSITLDSAKHDPIEFTACNAGATVKMTLYVVNSSKIPTGDYLKLVLPLQFPTQSFPVGTKCLISGTSHPCAIENSRTVAITAASDIRSGRRLTVVIPNILTPPTAGGTGYFKIFSKHTTGGQVIDINEVLGTVAFAPSFGSTTATVSVATGSTLKTGASATYIAALTLATAIDTFTTFRVTLPSEFKLPATLNCAALPSGSVPAVGGQFSCTPNSSENAIYVIGLNQSVTAAAVVTFSFGPVTNPGAVQTAGVSSFIVETLRTGTKVVLDRAVVSSPAIIANDITATLTPYSAAGRWTRNNVLLTSLTIQLTNAVPSGGSITITYGADVSLQGGEACFVQKGLTANTVGVNPCSATDGSSVVTLSGFASVPAKTQLILVIRLTLGTTDLPAVHIVSANASGLTIDEGSQSPITLLTKDSFERSTSSIAFPGGTLANGNGDIVVVLEPTVSLAAGSTVAITMPIGFSLNGSVVCDQLVSGSTTLTASCSMSATTVLITTKTDAVPSGTTVTFTLHSSQTGVGFAFPSLGSVPSIPQEWCIDMKAQSTSDYDNSGCMRISISSAVFTTASVTPMSLSPNVYTPVTFSIKFDVELPNTTNTAKLQLSFPTCDPGDNSIPWYANDLGTGLSSGTIAVVVGNTLAPKNTTIPITMNIAAGATPDSSSSPTILTLAKFNTIGVGTVITFDVVLQNPDVSVTAPITLKASYVNEYGFTVTTQTGSVSYTTASAAPGVFTAGTLTPRTQTTVSKPTVVTGSLQLSGATSSPSTALLFLIFPPGWSLPGTLQGNVGTPSATVSKTYSNSYAPIAILSLSASSIVGSSGTTPTSFSLGGLTNPYCDSLGAQALTAAVLDTVSKEYLDYAALTPNLAASVAAAVAFNVTSTSMSRLGWDVTYTFQIVTNNSYPVGSSISVTFPTGYDLSQSICDFSMSILDASASSPALCTIDPTALTATISQFAPIASGSNLILNVRVVRNIDIALTPPFQLTITKGSCVIEQKTNGPVLNLTTTAVPVNASAPVISFFPATAGAIADFSLTFTLQTAVPNSGSLLITFPAEYTLPAMTADNCILNYQYSSCSQVSNVLTIQPVARYSAGSRLTLEIPRMTVPAVTAANAKLKIDITWLGLTICTTPSSFNFTFAPSPATTTKIDTLLIVSPVSASETAVYNFSLTADSPLTNKTRLLLWFPLDYVGVMGDVRCTSTAAMNQDTLEVNCANPSSRGYLVLSGFKEVAAKTQFNVSVAGIINPETAAATSSILVATLNSTGAFLDVKSTGLTVTITAVPGYLWVKSITVSETNVKALTDYTFVFMSSIAVTANSQLWITLPEEYTNQALGFGAKYNCTGSVASAPTSSWLASTGYCSNPAPNRLVVYGLNSAPAADTFTLTLKNFKSPSIPGATSPFALSLYNPTTGSILARNYGLESGNDTITLTTSKHQIIVGLDNEVVMLTPGVTITLNIHTDSEKLPSRQILSFVPTLIGDHNTTGITLTPNPIVMNVGEFSTDFMLTTDFTVKEGDYLIKWSIVGDDMGLYTGIANTLLHVDPNYLFTVNVPTIPTLFLGKTSVPLKVTLDVVPLIALDVSFVCSVSSVTATVASFTPGSTLATFTVYVTNTTDARTATMSVTLHSTCCFQLSRSILYLAMTDYDDTPPEIAALILANPRGHLYTDITLQTTEAVTFKYVLGDRGMMKPNNDSLAYEMDSVATTVYIGNDFRYDFRVSNQVAESDYVIYGLMKDMNDNYMLDVFAIPYSTAGIRHIDLFDSVSFTLTFTAPPATGAIEQIVMPALIKQLAIPKSTQ